MKWRLNNAFPRKILQIAAFAGSFVIGLMCALCIELLKTFVHYFFLKTLDIRAHLWYNVITERERKIPNTRKAKKMKSVTVRYYAERVNGKLRYFKENRNQFGWIISKIEISEREYNWHTKG